MPVTDRCAESANANRRSFLSGLGKITLSATAIGLMTGHDRLSLLSSANAETVNNDVAILNAALGAEQEAVAAYQLGDEAMRWAVLRQALGQNPVPTAFLS